MDLYPRVLEMRQRVLAWLTSMQAPELGFGVHADSAFHQKNGPHGMYLPGTYNATHCLFLLGACESITPEQSADLAGFLNGFQREDGAYRIPEMTPAGIYYPDFEYIDLHTSNYTLGALALLGRAPTRPLAFMRRYDTPRKLADWLSVRVMTEPWAEGNYIVNVASFFAYLLDKGETRYRALMQQMLDWHTRNQDPASGYWYDPSTGDRTSAMAGAAHNLHIYCYLCQPVPSFEKIIDHCLSILEGISTACLDVDVVDILANLHRYGYRQAEIEDYLERKLKALLGFQNLDGGFADVRDGIRLFDGWEKYQEPQGLSNCFATWFRCITVGMICQTLYPHATEPWRFRNTLGIGYFDPRPLAAQSSGPDPATTAPVQASEQPVVSSSTSAAFGVEAEQMLLRIRARLTAIDPARLSSAAETYQIDITGTKGGSLTIHVAQGKATVEAGASSDARVCLSIAADTLGKLLDGKLVTTVAYMTKKLKIRGDISLAMKLDSLLK